MKNNNIPELLAPAGSFEALEAGINAGANAIYLGGKSFSARASANNFTNEEIEQAVDYAHIRGCKVYLAVNTIYKNTEIKQVLKFIEQMYVIGVDAFIVQDVALGKTIKEHMKDVEVHGSTQMTVQSLEGVQYLESLGFDRVVLSRELSLEEIKHITANSNIGIEIFIHGALCVSYSGQCTMSSHLGGRSGNRGKCAQNCRLQYNLMKDIKVIKKGYLLSPKDLITIDILPEIIASGVSSLKIEGRMKNAEYVGLVTKTYKDQLVNIANGNEEVEKNAFENLTQMFSRGGISTHGYLKSHAGSKMMTINSPKPVGTLVGKVAEYNPRDGQCIIIAEKELIGGDGIEIWTKEEPHAGSYVNKDLYPGSRENFKIIGNIMPGDLVYKSFDKRLNDFSKKIRTEGKRFVEILAQVKAVSGEPLALSLTYEDINVTLEGNVVEKATNQPLLATRLVEQLSKTGNTTFSFNFTNANVGEDIYIGISDINKLRREACAILEEKIIKKYKRDFTSVEIVKNQTKSIQVPKLNVLVSNKKQLDAVVDSEFINYIYVELSNEIIESIPYYCEVCKDNGTKLLIALPRVMSIDDDFEKTINKLENSPIDGYLIRTYGQKQLLKNTKKITVIDYTFNVFNFNCLEFMKKENSLTCLSTELNLEEIKDLAEENVEVVVHGRLPLMITRQCPVGLFDGHKEDGKFCRLKNKADGYYLKDRKDMDFPVKTYCDECIAYIYNSKTIFTLNKFKDIAVSGVDNFRLMFIDENVEDIKILVEAYDNAIHDEGINRFDEIIEKYNENGVTYGHFFRGIE